MTRSTSLFRHRLWGCASDFDSLSDTVVCFSTNEGRLALGNSNRSADNPKQVSGWNNQVQIEAKYRDRLTGWTSCPSEPEQAPKEWLIIDSPSDTVVCFSTDEGRLALREFQWAADSPKQVSGWNNQVQIEAKYKDRLTGWTSCPSEPEQAPKECRWINRELFEPLQVQSSS